MKIMITIKVGIKHNYFCTKITFLNFMFKTFEIVIFVFFEMNKFLVDLYKI